MAATVLLAGCGGSSAPQSGGPLGPPGNPGGACLPAAGPGQPESDGFTEYSNLGSAPLVITRVSLAAPRHLALLGSYLVPTGGTELGESATFPPKSTTGSPLPPGWAGRQKPGHFRLMPGKSVNIIVGIEATVRPGGMSPGVEIWYTEAGTSYVRKSNWTVQVSIPRCEREGAG